MKESGNQKHRPKLDTMKRGHQGTRNKEIINKKPRERRNQKQTTADFKTRRQGSEGIRRNDYVTARDRWRTNSQHGGVYKTLRA